MVKMRYQNFNNCFSFEFYISSNIGNHKTSNVIECSTFINCTSRHINSTQVNCCLYFVFKISLLFVTGAKQMNVYQAFVPTGNCSLSVQCGFKYNIFFDVVFNLQ